MCFFCFFVDNIESPSVVKEKIVAKDMENSKNGNY